MSKLNVDESSTANRLLLPPLSADRRAALKESIKQEGQRYAVIFNKNTGKLVDGGHRLEICQELGIDPLIDYQDLTEEQEAFLAISLNRDRRQLTPEQMRELAKQLRSEGFSQEQTASALGVYRTTISRWEAGTPSAPDLRVTIPSEQYYDIYRKVKMDGAKQSQIAANFGVSPARITQIVQSVESSLKSEHKRRGIAQRAGEGLPEGIKLLEGPFGGPLSHEVQDASVSLVLTDPPYGREFLPLWKDLGQFAITKLKEGGILAAYSGQYMLASKLSALLEAGLEYLWTLGIVFTGGQNNVFVNGINVLNKYNLILLFSHGKPSSSVTSIVDLLQGFQKDDKDLHEWAQPVSESKYLVEQLSKEGDLVVDPMMGSGTSVLAAHSLARRAIGFELDHTRFTIAKGRIVEALGEK